MVAADSSVYRPLSAGSTWTYRQHVAGTGLPTERSTRQIADGSGGVRETDLSGFDPDLNLQRNAAGDTVAGTQLRISTTRTVPIRGTEFTRELRAGQQIVVFDSRVSDVGDLDGDGRNDALDVAIWRTVVGFEDQVLPATGSAVRALRMDDRFVLRTVPTGSGAPQRIEGRSRSWYAEGVGPVRVLSLADDGVTPDDDLRLSGFDAGTRGLGFVPLTDGQVFAANAPGRSLVLGSVSLHLESSPEITRRDNRGRRLGVFPSRRDGDSPFSAQRLLQTRDGPRLITKPSDDLFGPVLIDALDAEGRFAGSRLGRIELSATLGAPCGGECLRVLAHPSSATVWLVSIEMLNPAPGVFQQPLTVRRLGTDGRLLGDPVRYTPPFNTSFISFEIRDAVARPSGLSVLLSEIDGGVDPAMRLVEFDDAGAVVLSRRYKPAATDSTFAWASARLLLDGEVRWLAWRGLSDTTPRVVRLAPNGAPVGVADTPEGLASARLDALPEAMRSGWPFNITSFGGAWWISGSEASTAFADGAAGLTRHTVIARLDPSDEAGLRGAPRLLRASAPEVGPQGLVFSDRVLWGTGSGGLGLPLLYWR